MNFIKERKLLVEYGKLMSKENLSTGTSGNLSIYDEKSKLVIISPSGIGYFDVKEEDMLVINLDGEIVEGFRKPSSEWQLHTYLYKNKKDIGAIVHTHSSYCTTFAALRLPLEPVHYVIADSNSNKVSCARYERYGTEKLAHAAFEAMGESKAVLLANHGLVTCGKSIKEAFSLASELEYLAKIQYLAQSIGKPVLLNDEEIEEVKKAFENYGQK